MAEAILRNRSFAEPVAEIPIRGSEPGTPPTATTTAAQELLDGLRTRWEDLKERVEKPAAAAGMSLKRELSQDADYVRIRARYYHEKRPLQTLGVVAAAAFAFGLILGLWRR